MEKDVSTVAMIRHTLLLPRKVLLTKNGIAIPTKRTRGYAADVTEIFCTIRPFLRFMFHDHVRQGILGFTFARNIIIQLPVQNYYNLRSF